MPETTKILVVDDEKMLLKSIQFRLKKEGYEIITAENGREAINILKTEVPDLIISDIMMPFINGLELVKHVKENCSDKIPVILLTTLRQEQNVMKAFELGADEFMTKPFSPSELVVRVRRVLMRNGIAIPEVN